MKKKVNLYPMGKKAAPYLFIKCGRNLAAIRNGSQDVKAFIDYLKKVGLALLLISLCAAGLQAKQIKPKIDHYIQCGNGVPGKMTPLGWWLYKGGVTRIFLIGCKTFERARP
jgi:hypothetical protein